MAINPSLFSSGKRAIVVGILTAVLLIFTSSAIGVTWDEPTYFAAAESYNGWFQRLVFGPHGVLHPSIIDQSWAINIEHPPADKVLSGLVWGLTRSLLGDLLAHRLGNILLFSLVAALLYHMISDELGGAAAIASVAALLAMPRFFFHAHLAALDVPAAGMIMIVTYFFWRTKESARFRYTLGLGIVVGLAAATRINTVLVVPTLLLWALVFRRRWYLLIRLVLSTIFAVPVFFLLWPWLYYDTVDRLKAFLKVAISWPIPQFYLGQNYMDLPWHFPFVMAAAVIPLGILILCVLGILRSIFRRRDRAFGFLMILGALIPLLAVASGQTKIYDNDRMLMPAFPFLAVLAGAGFGWVVKSVGALVVRFRIPKFVTPLLAVAAACAVWIPPVQSMVAYAPYWLSYYSETVGGLPGAAGLGLETTYWSESYYEAILYINANAEAGDTVWALPSSIDVLVYYQMRGILRKDVVLAGLSPLETIYGPETLGTQALEGFAEADFVIVQHRQSFLHNEASQPTDLLQWISSRAPAFRVERAGIPIVDVYTNP
ncbi:MAG: glycosyltransferase family 39 protein [Anaerolineales bacterium]|nr:glycosyltransferase family 39 protein [Anaerolineales bacterium]